MPQRSHPSHGLRALDSRAVVAQVRAMGRRVVTFSGFSAAGYADQRAVDADIVAILSALDPARTIVCSGATRPGIGRVYRLAKDRDFRTIGIVSARVLEDPGALAEDVDELFVVADTAWGGRLADGALAPTSAAIVAASDELVVIGGGEITRDEVEAALRAGRGVRYLAAPMSRAAARDRREAAATLLDCLGPVHAQVACWLATLRAAPARVPLLPHPEPWRHLSVRLTDVPALLPDHDHDAPRAR